MTPFSICAQVLVYLVLISCGQQLVRAQQKWQRTAATDQQQQIVAPQLSDDIGQKELDPSRSSAGEKVDRFASAIGDPFWPSQAEQLEWILQQATPEANVRAQPRTSSSLLDSLLSDSGKNNGNYLNQINRKQQPIGQPGALVDAGHYMQVGLDGPSSANLRSNYDALVDEFKQYSRLANPLRESRAFKPKLMSTARGFGKRAHSSDDLGGLQHQRISYSDLLAAANPNGAILTNGKMSGDGLSSKYAELIGQVLSRWPTMNKFVANKYFDYNGDGIVSTNEKYQSL